MKYLLIAIITSIGSHSFLNAQVSKDSELFLTLKKQDSLLFEKGFNQCDMTYLQSVVHKDLMFYHDKSGIQNRDKFFENTQKYICGDMNKKPVRKVDPGSLEVFAMYDNNVLYGAIQSGIHYFYLREPNKADVLTGKAKFTHLYLLQDGKWVLKEVFSFEHTAAN